LQDVDGALELAVRGVSAWLNSNLAALNLFTLGTTQKQTTVVASLEVVLHLTEHLDPGNAVGEGLLVDTDDLDVFVIVQLTALNTTGDNGATTGNGENVLDRHQEWLVSFTNWVWDGVIASLHQVNDGLYPLLFAVQGAQSGDVNDWS